MWVVFVGLLSYYCRGLFFFIIFLVRCGAGGAGLGVLVVRCSAAVASGS